MSKSQVQAWKLFLEGRLAQERGQHDEALLSFERAIAADPTNRSFHNAKAIALKALNREGEALLSKVAADYGRLASQLVGQHDRPNDWIAGLQSVLSDVEAIERGEAGQALAAVAW